MNLILKHRNCHRLQLIVFLWREHSCVWRSFLLRSRQPLLMLFLRLTWCQERVNYWSVQLQRCHRQECWVGWHTLVFRSHAHLLRGSETWFPSHRRSTPQPLICNRKPRNHSLWHWRHRRSQKHLGIQLLFETHLQSQMIHLHLQRRSLQWQRHYCHWPERHVQWLMRWCRRRWS